MGLWLKQSTAVTVKIGPFIDDTDGKTAETALTLTQADIRLSKNSGDIAQKNEANAATTDELGYYDCPLDTTDTNTLGRLQLFVHETGALPVFHEFMVVPANVWDSLFSTDRLQVDVRELGDSTLALTTQMKTDVNTEVATQLNTAIPVSNTVDSINDVLLDQIKPRLPGSGTISTHAATDIWSVATRALTDKAGFSLAADQSAATIGTVTTLTNWDKTGYALSAAGIDAVHDEVVEGAVTLRQAIRLYLAALGGKSAGGGTTTLTYRDNADTKARITATVDTDGNRTAVTLDAT